MKVSQYYNYMIIYHFYNYNTLHSEANTMQTDTVLSVTTQSDTVLSVATQTDTVPQESDSSSVLPQLSYTGQLYYTHGNNANQWITRFMAVKNLQALKMVNDIPVQHSSVIIQFIIIITCVCSLLKKVIRTLYQIR